jgi:uncharacterized membrane protein
MWIRGDLKARAKQALRENGYWIALAVVVIVMILSGIFGGAGRSGGGPNLEYRFGRGDLTRFARYGWSILPVGPALAGFLGILAALYVIFVANPLQVGKVRFFLEHRVRPSAIGAIFRPFTRGYLNAVKTVFLQGLFIFLWTLLLIIPGIIKAFQYILVPYILAENPDIEWRRALELSRKMTDGCKFDIFVLQLSFLGWYLLGLLALVIGTLFVGPYYEGTMAELYAALRLKALESGFSSESELPGVG